MKKLIVFILFCGDIFPSQLVLISDIDDTLKISAVKNSRFLGFSVRSEEFFGMSSLYNYFLCNQGPKDCLGKGILDKNIIYVTGQPGIVHKLGNRFLRKNLFPYPQNILWKSIKESTLDFKKEIIKKYIKKDPPDNKYILVGDNGEYDPLVYEYINSKYGDRILATFIRMIYLPAGKNHNLLPGQIPFLTSVDLGIHFYNMKLITGAELQKLIDGGNKELSKKINTVLKSWFACKYFRDRNWFPALPRSKTLDTFKKTLFKSEKCQ